jgi:hypothetical protein
MLLLKDGLSSLAGDFQTSWALGMSRFQMPMIFEQAGLSQIHNHNFRHEQD